MAQALRAGVPVERVHYGNTVKSDRDIAEAYRLGVRTFATDSVQDVAALAVHAPGARVFCRVATGGAGALWGLSDKFGCPPDDAVRVLERARELGLTPAGLSVHVGSQQMTGEAWRTALDDLGDVLGALSGRGIRVDHVNLGGGLPARGYRDRRGNPSIRRWTRSSRSSGKAWTTCAASTAGPSTSSSNPDGTSSPTTARSAPTWPASPNAGAPTGYGGTGCT